MSMLVRWLDKNQTVVYHRLEDRWTWAEFKKAHDETAEMMISVEHSVSLLVEFSDLWSALIPPRMRSNLLPLLEGLPPNHKMAIIVTKASFLHRAFAGVKRISSSNTIRDMRIVPSLDRAYELLGVSPDVLV